jgi:hypothetical protein
MAPRKETIEGNGNTWLDLPCDNLHQSLSHTVEGWNGSEDFSDTRRHLARLENVAQLII